MEEKIYCDFELWKEAKRDEDMLKEKNCGTNENPVDRIEEISIGILESIQPYSKEQYDYLKGFRGNLNQLTEDIYKYFEEYYDLTRDEIVNALDDTQIQKHYILETAIYLREMMISTHMFELMELTPIIVNLCKAGETLEVDLLDRLTRQYDFSKADIYIGRGRNKRLLDINKDWKKYSIGGLQDIIKGFAQSEYYGIKKKYEEALYNKFDEKGSYRYINKHLVKYQNYTKRLEECMDNWKDAVRNGNLHKHDTFTHEKVEEIFERSMELIALLIEWYNIVSKE